VPVDQLNINIRGARQVERALRDLPDDAQRELDQAKREVAEGLAVRVRAAGHADTLQSSRAADTVRADTSGARPSVRAGPEVRLFGSEFGIRERSRFGWYAAGRYVNSPGRQYRRHRGNASYWFFDAQERAQPWVDTQWREAESAIIASWGA
jgi:hypothetical protein